MSRLPPESAAALASLRRVADLEWYVVPLLAFVVHVYAGALRRRRWDVVVLALGFWAVELLWEMLNALVLRATNHAALWMVGKHSAYVVYVGLNLEIAFMFGVLPIVLIDLLPDDRAARIAGIPNRLFIPVAMGLFCVAVETVLWRGGLLVWLWPWWRFPHVWLICVAYCAPLTAFVWIHDHVSLRKKTVGMVIAIAAAVAAHLIFAVWLRWI